jgi:hypothetical protein
MFISTGEFNIGPALRCSVSYVVIEDITIYLIKALIGYTSSPHYSSSKKVDL